MLLMRKFILFSLFATLFSACKKEDNGKDCYQNSEVSSPAPYVLESRGSISFNGSIKAFQFVDENIGYAMCTMNVGGYVALFKTEDGGRSWKDLNLNIQQFPVGFTFKNEQSGIITVHDVTGCPPPGCLEKCVFYKTVDGGITWAKVELEQYKGMLYHPQFDKDGNLFAYLYRIDSQAAIVKSSDNGSTWNTFFTSPELGFSLATFSFEISGDKIYTLTRQDEVLVLSKDGTLLKTIPLGGTSGIWDFEIIDENNLVAVKGTEAIKTSDGGLSWVKIYDRASRIIGFDTPSEGLMFLNKNYCGSEGAYTQNDYLAYTSNGGRDWAQPANTTHHLVSGFIGSQKMGENFWYVIMGNKLISLKSH